MKGSLATLTLAALLAGTMAIAQQSGGIPDAPAPQPGQNSITALSKDVVPGSGTAPVTVVASGQGTQGGAVNSPDNTDDSGPAPLTPHTPLPDDQKEVPAFHAMLSMIQNVTYVQVPVTVKDKHGNLIPGLQWRDFRIYENNVRQHISTFSTDPVALSVALVIDQSVPQQVMARVNDALAAIPGAFAPYDELSVFTYNSWPKIQTDFTGSQSARLVAVLDRSKVEGRDTMIGPGSGPLGQEAYVNDTLSQTAPLASPGPTAAGIHNAPPRQVHPLNDAILLAAQQLSRTDPSRRRIIYVISDGREYGSQAKYKEVVQYLQEHKIAVYGTLVGDSATWGIGFLDRMHMPLMMAENILPQYSGATGGQFDAEFSIKGIERSFSAIAEQARTQYTIGYYSHESIYDGKFRAIEVQVTRPGFTIIAKKGYYPSAPDKK